MRGADHFVIGFDYQEPVRNEQLAALTRCAQGHFRYFGVRGNAAWTAARRPGASVTEVATRWGFFHFGRISQQYPLLYGECHSQTPGTRRPQLLEGLVTASITRSRLKLPGFWRGG